MLFRSVSDISSEAVSCSAASSSGSGTGVIVNLAMVELLQGTVVVAVPFGTHTAGSSPRAIGEAGYSSCWASQPPPESGPCSVAFECVAATAEADETAASVAAKDAEASELATIVCSNVANPSKKK